MRVTTVTIGRNHNVGPRSIEKLELSIALEEGDTVEQAVAKARATIAHHFGELPAPDTVERAEEIIAVSKTPRFE